MPQPFHGITVIDLTHVLAGPFATYQLAVLGADVIKIENPSAPDQVRQTGVAPEYRPQMMDTNYLTQGSNKKAMTLDLKHRKGQQILMRLIERADVLVENYRPGAMDALGLGYDALRACNPDLIYCSMTAFGSSGPERTRTGYDQVIQAASGLMSVTGTPEVAPLKVGVSVVDYATGLTGAFAISAALLQRERGGGGQHIDLAMMDVAMMLMSTNVCGWLTTGRTAAMPRGNAYVTPNGSCYQTADGLLMIAALNRRQHQRLWTALGRPEYCALGGYQDLTQYDAEMREALGTIFAARPAAEWEKLLTNAGVPASRVRTIPEALAMEQVKARPNLVYTHPQVDAIGGPLTVPVAAFTLGHDGHLVDSHPPTVGQDTDRILCGIGMGTDEIAALRAEKVI
ncbi:MAG: CoA transferase [Lautropia sp.]